MQYSLWVKAGDKTTVEAASPEEAIRNEAYVSCIVDAESRNGSARFQVDRLGRIRKLAEYTVAYRS